MEATGDEHIESHAALTLHLIHRLATGMPILFPRLMRPAEVSLRNYFRYTDRDYRLAAYTYYILTVVFYQWDVVELKYCFMFTCYKPDSRLLGCLRHGTVPPA